MRKATWIFANGSQETRGATGDLFVLIEVGHRLATRKRTTLIGWKFSHKLKSFIEEEGRLLEKYPYP